MFKNKNTIIDTGTEGIYQRRKPDDEDSAASISISDDENAKPLLKTFFDTLRRKKNDKKSPVSDISQARSVACEEEKNILSKEKNNIQDRSLPAIPLENEDQTIDPKESDYVSIDELSLEKSNQNNGITDSSLKIWNNLTPSAKEILKNINSHPMFKNIVGVIKASSGNKEGDSYILAKFCFDSLANSYKKEEREQENSCYMLMNGVQSHATFANLFENVELMILEGWDCLFDTKASINMTGEKESVYMNIKSSFFSGSSTERIRDSKDGSIIHCANKPQLKTSHIKIV